MQIHLGFQLPNLLVFMAFACDLSAESSALGGLYSTRTPYQPEQETSAYEPPPVGFTPVFTQLVARHGSRCLTGFGDDAAVYSMWQKAQLDGALTELGAKLGPDIMRLMRANALMGVGVPDISKPGYGNLTLTGIAEHKGLAARLMKRLSGYFSSITSKTTSATPRSILIVNSGVDRAVDSSKVFVQSLTTNKPELKPLIIYPVAPVGYPQGAPLPQPEGTNRFLLYFNNLNSKTDLVTDKQDKYYQTYQDSIAYQKYEKDADLKAKIKAISTSPAATIACRTVLLRLFTQSFLDKLENGAYEFANTGTFTFTSNDGSFSTTLVGDGKKKVNNLSSAAEKLYSLYSIVPSMTHEIDLDFRQYIPAAQAAVFSYIADAKEFYIKGPGIKEHNPITYKMAQILKDDFFNEIDAIAKGDLSHGAKLRFAHAETIIPFAAILGLKDVSIPVVKSETYTHENNPWRGEHAAPFAANVQWDVFRNNDDKLLLRMLYNEKEVDFNDNFDGARYAPNSHYYYYEKLRTCSQTVTLFMN